MLNFTELELVLKDWNYWDKELPKTTPRSVLKSIDQLSPDLITAIQGVRHCGKSTLLIQLIEHFKINPRDCFIVNFEDPRLVEDLDFTLLDRIVEFAINKRPKQKKYYFFLDEIQNVVNWEQA